MDLQSVTLHGFRRFADSTQIKTNGKLVALLGPNEAGKTSILTAIEYIGNSSPIDSRDLTRGKLLSPKHVVISAKFRLDVDDLEAAGLSNSTVYTLNKLVDGSRTASFYPPVPKRDISKRSILKDKLDRIKKNNRVWGRLVENDQEIIDNFDEIDRILSSEIESLPTESIDRLKSFSEYMDSNCDDRDPAYVKQVPLHIEALVEHEKSDTPDQIARKATFGRLPRFLFFSEDDRLLDGSYHIDTLDSAIPSAFDNIAKVANLDTKSLIKAIRENDTPTIARLKELANRTLKDRFDEDWSQSGIHVAFEVHNNEIEVLVKEENFLYTKLAERSEGLRQFVALQTFTTCERASNPVLLIDEAEIRLHYDAQADLIHMLTRQGVAAKIIYTTHSAGCLPEDLGNGVRLVCYKISEQGEATSYVKNHFWNRSQGGLEPLLFGMGAATLAFFPIRKALLTEGESDMLLLPTMLRECYGEESLGYQVVPGLSKTSGINLPILARNGTGIAFALDFDAGGRDVKRKIIAAGFDEGSIFFLKGDANVDCQIEDFINANALVAAVNQAFNDLGVESNPIRPSHLPSNGRVEAIRKFFKLNKSSDVPKTLIAYHVLEYMVNNPTEKMVDARKSRAFNKFAAGVRAALIDTSHRTGSDIQRRSR